MIVDIFLPPIGARVFLANQETGIVIFGVNGEREIAESLVDLRGLAEGVVEIGSVLGERARDIDLGDFSVVAAIIEVVNAGVVAVTDIAGTTEAVVTGIGAGVAVLG